MLFMSPNRLTIACRMAGSAVPCGGVPCGPEWTPARPAAQFTVPAPKTRAPLAARYSVIECVAEPAPNVTPWSCSSVFTLYVLLDILTRPAGLAPLSRAESHSYPMMQSQPPPEMVVG